MHGNHGKINIFKCNKFNILSYTFCFSPFFNGSAFSLYRLVITSLSLCREMRPPDSTNCVFTSFHSFFHFTKSSPKHPLHRGKALCHVLGIRQRPRTHLPVPPGAHRLAPKEFITCLSHTRGNEHWHFVAGKSLRDLFIPGLILTTATFY